jgi:hypothetical protein
MANADRLRKIQDLGKMLETEECRTLAVAALKRALSATRSFCTGGRDGGFETEPDYHAQILAAKILLAYTDGAPVKRSLIMVSDDRKVSAEEHNRMISEALRLPAERGEEIAAAKKAKTNGHSS